MCLKAPFWFCRWCFARFAVYLCFFGESCLVQRVATTEAITESELETLEALAH